VYSAYLISETALGATVTGTPDFSSGIPEPAGFPAICHSLARILSHCDTNTRERKSLNRVISRAMAAETVAGTLPMLEMRVTLLSLSFLI
jgi:hypothetical protein